MFLNKKERGRDPHFETETERERGPKEGERERYTTSQKEKEGLSPQRGGDRERDATPQQ